jgi:hypothetical protein
MLSLEQDITLQAPVHEHQYTVSHQGTRIGTPRSFGWASPRRSLALVTPHALLQ